ncbi:hypothetical protein BTVI_41216 [Pitangus sulphuratus]|nr:hypothetical protein BTVI_41216 [Pitangus sulphuratus]
MESSLTLTKFFDDTKLSGKVDTLEGRTILQGDLHRLEEWSNENLVKSNRDKSKVLHLGKHNPGPQHRLGSTWLRSSSVLSQMWVFWKTSAILGCINKGITSRDKEVIILLYLVLARPHLECCVHLWSLLLKKVVEGPEKGHKDDQSLSCEERLRELGLFSLENRWFRGDLMTMFRYLKGNNKDDEYSLFTGNPMEKIEADLKVFRKNDKSQWAETDEQRVPADIRKNSLLCVTTHWNRLPREVVKSRLLEIFRNCLDSVLRHAF